MATQHNNANIITFGARTLSIEHVWEIVQDYLSISFLGGIHETRVKNWIS
jgi:ribose 5-phosphate isomerase RpiB